MAPCHINDQMPLNIISGIRKYSSLELDPVIRRKKNFSAFSSFHTLCRLRFITVILVPIALSLSCRRGPNDKQQRESGPSQIQTIEDTDTTTNQKLKARGANLTTAADWLSRWDELVVRERGTKGLEKRKAFAAEALETVGGGATLGAIIDGLDERRATDTCDWLITNGKEVMFTGSTGEESRKWLNEVANIRLKERLCFYAGFYFSGPRFKDYLTGMSPASAQSRLLTGYCCGIAESEPIRAMDEFANLRPAQVSFGGLKEVVCHFPEDADFAKIALRYGDDFNEANSLAKAVRGNLLKRWAKFLPEEAGRFVIDNPKLVAIDQIPNVIAPWLDDNPEEVVSWVDKLPVGGHRDVAYEFLARYYLTKDAVKSWNFVSNVGDFQKRVETATAVFKEWEKTDRESATRAWTALFPAQ